MGKIRLAVSASLLGREVRYDGGHKHDRYINDQYRKGFVPLIVPITIIRHYVRKYGEAYLEGQMYFAPHPAELMLRNHV